jgi:hypothetical protein
MFMKIIPSDNLPASRQTPLVLSLMIPAYRDSTLQRKLETLTQQTLAASSFEVLVVVLERGTLLR